MDLPSTGSADQVKQCIEDKMVSERERERSNMVVIICEVEKHNQVILLVDEEVEFLRSDPIYKAIY